MVIQHNLQAMNANRQLGTITSAQSKSTEKLSSGYRINRAGDDAAGLAISEKMRGQIRGLNRASDNSQDAISLIQTAEGALTETHSILQRMRELAVQAANDTNVASDRSEIQKEINELSSEINRIGNTTEFNTMKLLNGDRTSDSRAAIGVTLSSGASVQMFSQTKGVSITGNIGDYLRTTTATTTAVQNRTGFKLENLKGAANINITKNGNQLVVTGEVKESGTSATISINQTVMADSEGNYKVDAKGSDGSKAILSFVVVGEDFDKIDNASTLTYATNTASGLTTIRTTPGITSTFGDGKNFNTPSVSVKTVSGTSDAPALSNISFDISKITAGATIKATVAINVELADGTKVSSDVALKDLEGFGTNGDTYTAKVQLGKGIGSIEVKFTGISGSGTITGTLATSDMQKITSSVTHDVSVTGGDSLTFQVGANQNQSMALSIGDMRASALGITGTGTGFTANAVVSDGTSEVVKENALDVTSSAKAASAVTVIDSAIQKVSAQRSKLGAVQNRLEHTIANLDTASENLQASESRIRDVNMAEEMMNFTKNNILSQASQAMLAQANQSTQNVLSLLR